MCLYTMHSFTRCVKYTQHTESLIRMRFESTFGLSMLETWEKALVCKSSSLPSSSHPLTYLHFPLMNNSSRVKTKSSMTYPTLPELTKTRVNPPLHNLPLLALSLHLFPHAPRFPPKTILILYLWG